MVQESKRSEELARRNEREGRRTFMIALVIATAATVIALGVAIWLQVDEQSLKPAPLPARAPQGR